MSEKSGGFFQMEDGEGGREKRQSRRELSNLREEFMGRAKQFMDDTALGDGRKALQGFLNRVQGKEEEAEQTEAPLVDPELEDDWEDEGPEPEELDWNRPEYIRAGYVKPGTKVESAKTLEEAQEESFNLRLGNLSGLLSRFGSEDAVPEAEAVARSKEMDKPFFRAQMARLYAALSEQTGEVAGADLWLHPEALTLLRAHQTPERILLFVMAAVFADIPENYLTQADQVWVAELMLRAGFLLENEAIQRQVDQTFLFAERVHRLYESLLEDPLRVDPVQIEQYRENLAKLAIFEIAKRYEADPRTVIRTLAAHWQALGLSLQSALEAVKPLAEQYVRFQQRNLASGSVFAKLRQAEALVLSHYTQWQALARDIELLKQITSCLQEEDALHRLMQFETHWCLPAEECRSDATFSLVELRQRFVQEQLGQRQVLEKPPAADAFNLSPIEQKRAISRAKEGEIKSLYLIDAYKQWRLHRS